MNLTLEQLSADIWHRQQRISESSPQSPSMLPAEILCATLDTMPSRRLLRLRSISPQFAASVDHILRCRMVAISTSKNYEVLFTSCSPMEAGRAHRQVLRLSHFEPSVTAGASEVATFTMAANPPIPQTLALDDEESFGLNLVAIHLHAVPTPLPSPPLTPDPSDPSSMPLPSFAATSFAPPPQRWDFQLSLGSAHPRLFRSWFEDPSLAVPIPAYPSPSSSPTEQVQKYPFKLHRPTTSTRTLHIPPSTSSPSSLLSATLLCSLVAPSPPAPSSTVRGYYGLSPPDGRGYTPTPPRMFEFVYEIVRVDVGRFVVAAEEGMGMGEEESAEGVILVLGR